MSKDLNPDKADKRQNRDVPVRPAGSLSDYIPFYFTPYSPMMLNIKTGYGGVRQRRNDEVVIFVTSLHTLQKQKVDFVYTDRHAYLRAAEFSSDLGDLGRIDWGTCRSGISNATTMILASSSAIKPKR